MPFITEVHRQNPDIEDPGDRCYIEYKKIMDAWHEAPRWRTVDRLMARFVPMRIERAFVLAFLVFFHLHVMPYELQKRQENGSV